MQFFGGSDISRSPPVPNASGNNAHMMYVFNRNGVCLVYREWNRPLHTLNAQQDHKLIAEKGNLGMPQLLGQGCSFHSFRTNNFMETPSGIKIILVNHPKTTDLRESLKYIYNLYVEYVVKNPIYAPGTPIRSGLSAGGGVVSGQLEKAKLDRCELFNTSLDQYVRSIA